jgi:hypothetical protein
MDTTQHIERPDPADLNRLHDAARQRAVALRGEAIDDFWRGVHSTLWAQLSGARRAASRLSHRVQHHQALRDAAARHVPARHA